MAKIEHVIAGTAPLEIVLKWWSRIEDDGTYVVGFNDRSGMDYSILSIGTDGTTYLYTGLSKHSGLNLDEDGRLIIEKGND